MKRILVLVVFSIVSNLGKAQVFHRDSLGMPALNGEVGMQEIILMDSVSKNELYNRAKVWVATTFKSAKNVTQLDDADNGILIIKGITTVYIKTFMAVADLDTRFMLKIEVKDTRCRYTLNSITMGPYNFSASDYWKSKTLGKNGRVAVNESLQSIVATFKKGIQTPISSITDKW